MNLWKKPAKPAKPVDASEIGSVSHRMAYPNLYKNAPLVLLTPDGNVIGRVRLDDFSTTHLNLVRLPGEFMMPEVEVDSKILASGETGDGEVFTLETRVQEASKLYIRLVDLALVEHPSRRMHPRYIINRQAEVTNLDNPKLAKTPQPCELVDISMSGAKIISNYEYSVGRDLRLRVELYDKAGQISFVSQVLRAKPLDEHRTEYGLIFAELTQMQRTYLTQDLQVVRDNIRARAGR